MKSILFIACLLTIFISNAFAESKKGKDSSFLYLSDTNVFDYDKITDFIVLGDSFSATGTNYTTMHYTGANVTGGRNWPLHLRKLHNNMKLWNFAKSGAVIDFKIVPRRAYKVSFVKQGDVFVEKMSKGKKFGDQWKSENTMAILWIGANDIRCIKRPEDHIVDDKYEILLKEFLETLEKMYKADVKNFVIMNVPPLTRAPFNLKGSYPYYQHDVDLFNNAFKNISKDLHKKYDDINIIVYNTNAEYSYIMDHCQDFNLQDCTHAWKLNKTIPLSASFWKDYSHLSAHGNKHLAVDLNELLESVNKK